MTRLYIERRQCAAPSVAAPAIRTLSQGRQIEGFEVDWVESPQNFQWQWDVEPGLEDVPLLMLARSFDGRAGSGQWAGWPGQVAIVPRWLRIRDPEGKILWVEQRLVGEAQFLRRRSPDRERLSEAIGQAEWAHCVGGALRLMRTGAVDKVVLARCLDIPLTGSGAASAFASLRDNGHYERDTLFWVKGLDDRVWLGSTPETLFELRGQSLSSEALAGTALEGPEPLASDKIHREHAAVRRFFAERLAGLSQRLSVEDAQPVQLKNLWHLRSAIHAVLAPHQNMVSRALHLLHRLHPSPAVSGLPQVAAMQAVTELEAMQRGWYAGALGWVAPQWSQMVVGLRSALVDQDQATLFAGAGLVEGSDADEEWAETEWKMTRMREVLSPPEASLSQGLIARVPDSLDESRGYPASIA